MIYNQGMKYLTTREIAEKWNISDRRVRILCEEGRVEGAVKEGKSYMIPHSARKPEDKRYRMAKREPAYFLKWGDETIASIDGNMEVSFFLPEYNQVVWEYTHGEGYWDRNEFEEFLRGRIVSADRRDIEHLLFRCGLSRYDVIKLGLMTRAICSRDILWIAKAESEKMSDVMTDVFDSVFNKKADLTGDSIDTPEGQNIKRYGVFNGAYGIYKKRISPIVTDVESELAVYGLAKLMGVECCPVYRVDEDTIFSQFRFDFAREYIVHMRRLFRDERSSNEYLNLLSVRPQYQKEIVQMIALDFVTRQDDRHLSNIAVKIGREGECFYPLYDNGRSLFYEDTEETVAKAIKDVKAFASCFGPEGTYYDYVKEISDAGIDFSRIMNLNISEAQIKKILQEAGFTGYRLEGGIRWIYSCLEILKKSGHEWV